MIRAELLFRGAGFEVIPAPRLLLNFDRRHPALVHSPRRCAETNRSRLARNAWLTVLLGATVKLCLGAIWADLGGGLVQTLRYALTP